MSFRRSNISRANKLPIFASLCSAKASLESDFILMSTLMVSHSSFALPNGRIRSLLASLILYEVKKIHLLLSRVFEIYIAYMTGNNLNIIPRNFKLHTKMDT